MVPCGLGEYYTMLRVMETQLGASKAGCSTVSCCRAAIFDSQQKGNNKLFYLAQRKDKLRVQLPNALHLFFLFHWENSIAWVVLAWASQWWALSLEGLGFGWKVCFCGCCWQKGPRLKRPSRTASAL